MLGVSGEQVERQRDIQDYCLSLSDQIRSLESMLGEGVLGSGITPLTEKDASLADSALGATANLWRGRRPDFAHSTELADFIEKIENQWAIETGVIENLYTLDRGVTETLIEHGIKGTLISHADTDKDTNWVAQVILDQKQAIQGLFDFVNGTRELSTSYIKELHAELTRSQRTVMVMTPEGHFFETEFLRGEYKCHPNNPKRASGEQFTYCPPEQVASEMDNLIQFYEQAGDGFAPEVVGAWLHHRFTQIHPFQDGNGRVARALATLVFLKAELLPVVVTRDEKVQYIDALEKADAGNLSSLVHLIATLQRELLSRALAVLPGRPLEHILSSVAAKVSAPIEGYLTEEEVELALKSLRMEISSALDVFEQRLSTLDRDREDRRFNIVVVPEPESALLAISHPRFGNHSIRFELKKTKDPMGIEVHSVYEGPGAAIQQPLSAKPFKPNPAETDEQLKERIHSFVEETVPRGLSIWDLYVRNC